MALIPPFFVDCVVAIGVDDAEGKRKWIATGFLYGNAASKSGASKSRHRVYLVTNRHVFQGLSRCYLRFNPQADEPAREYDLPLLDEKRAPLWHGHPSPEIDVAVIPVRFHHLREHAMQVGYFHGDMHAAPIDKMQDLGITEGDFAYVLGFPIGLVGGERDSVIVRSGSIARIRDALARANQTFLVDAFVFPGNSGGPVVSKPEMLSITGTKSQGAAYLIGIVYSYLTYNDVAVSLQTNRSRVIFEENSGLAAVHPVDFVEETIRSHLDQTARTGG